MILAAVLVVASCRTVTAETIRLQAKADSSACYKVSLLGLGADPFGPTAQDCTVVVWDTTMPGIQIDMNNAILPPKAVMDAAETGGFHLVCSFGTNDFKGWVTRLPPGQKGADSWHGTMWTRATKSARTRAACVTLEGLDPVGPDGLAIPHHVGQRDPAIRSRSIRA